MSVRPSKVFTLNELQHLVPSLKLEHFKSELPKVKEALSNMFHRLGCDFSRGVDIQEGVTTRNIFKEEDNSVRFLLSERLDEEWLNSGNASAGARAYTKDYTMYIDMVKMQCGKLEFNEDND